ncbi:alpha/beta hydrolase [Nocardioides nitrophenolicus]|uniref:alpha/beta hydrolase n=1 Tax=Nocardioides nitrophenolicus TaxID=60489 RepID=UPI00195A1A8C|nr:alpha/beta hydrolase [Nocardioides nitrophenolicus]MBM7520054.1 alpha-beta hydrolase superfamily lysophospholipase [Nocardioides nitrophenolicus]
MSSTETPDDGVAEMTAATRSRAVAAGIDVHEYDAVTGALTSLDRWSDSFRDVAAGYVRTAVAAREQGLAVTSGEAFLTASAWYYFAGSWPSPRTSTYQEAAQAQAAALAVLDPGAERVEGDRFRGVLRRPATESAALVVLVPGLDGAKEELWSLAEALLARGCATLVLDGPGQGELVGVQAPTTDYPAVVREALDAVLPRFPDEGREVRAGILACSLGGLYATATLAAEPRLRAGVVVSGLVKVPPYADLPPLIQGLLTVRTGDEEGARRFTGSLDVTDAALAIDVPLLVVDGDADPLVHGDFTGRWLAEHVTGAERRVVAGGDHNIANARGRWLPGAADWLAQQLGAPVVRAVPA